MLYSYGLYVWKTSYPTGFALDYPHPLQYLATWRVALAALFLAGVSVAVWKQHDSRPYLVVGWLWYLGTLVPVIGIVQVGDQGMADRYAYLPLIGIFVMVVWGFSEWADRVPMKPVQRVILAGAVLGVLALLTRRQLNYWQSEESVWAHALDVTTNNVFAENNRANTLRSEGRVAEALPHFEVAAGLQPWVADRHVNLPAALAQGRTTARGDCRVSDGRPVQFEPGTTGSLLRNVGYALRPNRRLWRNAPELSQVAERRSFFGFPDDPAPI